jgi:integrating conjugative element protein (TIGR03746 family)
MNDMDIRGKRGELTGRVRVIQPIVGQGYEERRVDVIDADTWVIWLDYRIQETVRGMEVKHLKIRYPLRVVRYNVDPETNPWGLALDGFGTEGPQKIIEEDPDARKQELQNTP